MTQLKVLRYSLKKYQSARNPLAINLMQTIINIQIFTYFSQLREAKFLLATKGICHHTGGMNAPVEQLTSSIKKEKKDKMAEVAVHRSKQPSFGYLFFFKVGNLG